MQWRICRHGGLSNSTFYKWRTKLGGTDASAASRLRELEGASAKLKRQAIEQLISKHPLSERRVCGLARLSLDRYRLPAAPGAMEEALSKKIVEIAHAQRRFAFAHVHGLLVAAVHASQSHLRMPALQGGQFGGAPAQEDAARVSCTHATEDCHPDQQAVGRGFRR